LAAIVAFAGVAFTDQVFFLYTFIMVGAVSGLAAPAINGVLSRQVPDNAQGELQGAVNAANSLATIIGPLAATQIFSYFTSAPTSPGYFPGAPFVAAAFCVVLALVLFATAAWRFELGHRPSLANRRIIPDMPPPGQVRVPPIDEDE
jgi:DHA1 family tetracycline resistance protein-like MFS transporter